MSEQRAPMKPALGLVRDRVSTLPSRKAAAAPADDGPAAQPELSVEEALAAERAKEEAFEKQAAPRDTETTRAQPTEATKAKAKAKTKATKVSETTGGTKRTSLSLPQELVDLMTERRASTPKVGQVQFILNAIAQTAPRLKELVEAENGGTVGNDMFPVSTALRGDVGKLTTITFDTAEANMVVLDKLQDASGAESRSQLVRVALREVLGA